MKPGALACAALLLALLPAPPAAAAGSMRCGSRIIDEGTLAAAMLAACGPPAYRDVWQPGTGAPDWADGHEEWYYNFGPSQLLRVVRVRDGRVSNIDADGYGFAPGGVPRCEPLAIVEGLSEYRLLSMCGAPLSRRSETVVRRWRPHGGLDEAWSARHGGGFYAPVHREEWIYNFGSRYLLRIVTLEDGRVADVQNGDRGFD